MKKFVAIFCTLVLSVCLLCGCGSVVTSEKGYSGGVEISAQDVDDNLQYFLGIDQSTNGTVGNRYPFGESEKYAAERLYEHFNDKEKYPHLSVNDFTFEAKVTTASATMTGTETKTVTSQNVEIKIKHPDEDVTKQVIIGTGYGGSYGKLDEEKFTSQAATGAFESGTGVATVMSLIDYCESHYEQLMKKIDFDLVFVFFGCSSYNTRGATEYAKSMSGSECLNTLLMFNLHSFGGEQTYMYCDETQTAHETFLRNVATDKGLAYYTLPNNMPLIEAQYFNDVAYTHFGMLGDHAPFFAQSIPTVNIFSAYYGSINLSDLEKKGEKNVRGTVNDTYGNLKSTRAQYAEQGRQTAALVIESLTNGGFAAAMTNARKERVDYTFWTQPLWPYLMVLGCVILLGVLLIVLVKHFEKKYPYQPLIKKMKIAVFGMDYETPSENDVYVDIKSRPKNPFDGY